MDYNNLFVVIPAYEPNIMMLDLIDNLNQVFENEKIIIVNDGSNNAALTFKTAKNKNNVIILDHDVNKGKGAALKTAFKYLNDNIDGKYVIVTCDADGQHKIDDIKKVVDAYLTKCNEGIVLGSRYFHKNMPKRSKFGNDATIFLYRAVNSYLITDNQTGLRVFGNELLDTLINIPGDKYEYEMNMLMELNRQSVNIYEVKIEAVYIDNNSSSHFRPVKDFMRICHNILKYGIPGLIGFILEISMFILFINLFKDIIDSSFVLVIIASLISGTISFIFDIIVKKLGILYSNKWELIIKKRRIKYLLIGAGTIFINSIITSCFVLIVEDITNAKIINEIVSLALTFIIKYTFIPKPKII